LVIPGSFLPVGLDWIYLLILGIICTSIAWVLATRSLLTVTAYDSLMVINLEPIYGILMALLILNDRHELSTSFYVGTAIIFATSNYSSYLATTLCSIRNYKQYTDTYSNVDDPVLEEVERSTHLHTIAPQMLSGRVQGKLLTWLRFLYSVRVYFRIRHLHRFQRYMPGQGIKKFCWQ
jgi:hypothetical protein